jgi:hypothetical protein
MSSHRFSTALASLKKLSRVGGNGMFIEPQRCDTTNALRGLRSRIVIPGDTYDLLIVVGQSGTEKVEDPESTELLDDASLTSDEVELGVLTEDNDCIVHKQGDGAEQIALSWMLLFDNKRLAASPGCRNHRSSYASWSQWRRF